MKLSKILIAGILSVSFANADVMRDSMNMMQKGIEQVQFGFINYNEDLIRDGLVMIKKGNKMFSGEETINKYLPNDKKHMLNTAVLSSVRINIDLNIIEANLDSKAYTKAADGYADMLNACSRCHAIIRDW